MNRDFLEHIFVFACVQGLVALIIMCFAHSNLELFSAVFIATCAVVLNSLIFDNLP